MTNATMNRDYKPARSPLFGIFAVVATAVTMGVAVLLPASLTPGEQVAATAAAPQRSNMQAAARFVTLPAVEVVGTRQTKSASGRSLAVPVVFKQKG
jgi:hypothetical protein